MKLTNRVLRGIGLLPLFFLFACAHSQVAKSLDQKVQTDQALPGNEDLGVKAEQVINSEPNLTAEQKSRLLDLQKRTHDQSTQYRDESFKLRDLLITDVTQPNYNEAEVNLIKKRLKKIEGLRLDAIFKAVDDANKILGRKEASNYRILHAIEDYPERTR